MAIEIVYFPIENGGSFHSKLLEIPGSWMKMGFDQQSFGRPPKLADWSNNQWLQTAAFEGHETWPTVTTSKWGRLMISARSWDLGFNWCDSSRFQSTTIWYNMTLPMENFQGSQVPPHSKHFQTSNLSNLGSRTHRDDSLTLSGRCWWSL